MYAPSVFANKIAAQATDPVSADLWTRPSYWPALPATQANYVDGLVAVSDHHSNYVAITTTCTNGFTVNWGDGTTETFSSGATASHSYDYSNANLSAVTPDGYKLAVVRVYPTNAGNNITAITLNAAYSTSSTYSNYVSTKWVELQINLPYATTCYISRDVNGAMYSRMLKHVAIYALAVTAGVSMFQTCSELECVEIVDGGWTTITGNCSSMFQDCVNLVSVKLGAGTFSGAGLTNCANFFSGCYRLKYVELPSGAFQYATSVANFFYGCSSLRKVVFCSGFGAAATTWGAFFQNCSALTSVDLSLASFAAVTDVSSLFNGCSALESVTWPSTINTGITTISAMFSGCTAIRYIDLSGFTLTSCTTWSTAFSGCRTVEHIILPNITHAASSAYSNIFATCYSLRRVQNCKFNGNFTLSAAAMMHNTELDEIYTALPTVSAKTLTLGTTFSSGASTKSIATGKGWTVS